MQDDEDTIKILKDKYKERLPNKIETIQSQWQRLAEKWEKKKMNVLFQSIHMLSGSAGSYGFPKISDAAKELEFYLNQLMKETKPISNDEKKSLEMLLNNLQNVINHHLATHPNSK
jgi:HPt (histidine-containing phosphotransfer) domain-containing protein